MEYKMLGNHAQDLADGRMLAPGETVELSEEEANHPHNASLLHDGVLFAIEGEDSAANASDAAIALAAEHNIELAAVTPTGAGGQIIKADVERVIAEAAASSEGGK